MKWSLQSNEKGVILLPKGTDYSTTVLQVQAERQNVTNCHTKKKLEKNSSINYIY